MEVRATTFFFFFFAQEERLEGRAQGAPAYAAAPICTWRTPRRSTYLACRILDASSSCSEVAREFISVPGEQPELGIELGPVQ